MSAAAIILAAGAGRRLGTVAKALLRRGDGKTFLAAIAHTAAGAGVRDLIVVVGPPHGSECEREALECDLTVVHNPESQRGMASSVAVGFAHLTQHVTGTTSALLWPVDHAMVKSDTVRTIVARASSDSVVIPTYAGRGGHPPAFGCDIWPRLASCHRAERGARSVIDALPAQSIIRLPVTDAGVIHDVDTPEQMAQMAQTAYQQPG